MTTPIHPSVAHLYVDEPDGKVTSLIGTKRAPEPMQLADVLREMSRLYPDGGFTLSMGKDGGWTMSEDAPKPAAKPEPFGFTRLWGDGN